MQRRRLVFTLVPVLTAAVGLFTAAASAKPPDKSSFTFVAPLPLTGYCSFPITVNVHADFVVKNFFDSSGTLVRTQAHVHEQDVFSANGISLTGLPFSFTLDFYFAPDGTVVKAKSVGVAEKIPLPDGTLFIVAGQLDLLTTPPGTDFFISVTHGNPGDTAALCAALTP
jgi:hypothetical protein